MPYFGKLPASSVATDRLASGSYLAFSYAQHAMALRSAGATRRSRFGRVGNCRLPKQWRAGSDCSRSSHARRPDVGHAGLPATVSTTGLPIPFGKRVATATAERRARRINSRARPPTHPAIANGSSGNLRSASTPKYATSIESKLDSRTRHRIAGRSAAWSRDIPGFVRRLTNAHRHSRRQSLRTTHVLRICWKQSFANEWWATKRKRRSIAFSRPKLFECPALRRSRFE